MINKYSLWNIAAFGGGGGEGGGGNQGPSSLNAAEGKMSPAQREVSYGGGGGGGGGGGNNAAAQAQAQADAQAQVAHEAAISQPPATTSFTTAAFPDSIVPTGGFTSGYPSSNALTDQVLSGANSAQVAGQALDSMGVIPSPQMAADLAAMGGVPAPGTPMPTARPDNLGPEYSNVSFSGVPSFAQTPGTGQAMTAPGGNSAIGTGSPRDYNTAQQALNQAAQDQDVSGYGSLMAASTGQPASATDIMNRIVDLVVPKAQAEDTPPTNTVLPGNVPLPPARPADLNQETPNAAQTLAFLANVPLPPARPEDINKQLKASVVTPPAPTTPFETAVKSIVDEAPKNLTNTAVGFIPGVGLVNTISGLVGGPTVGGTLFPSTSATTENQTSTPYIQDYSGLTQDQFRAMPVDSVEDPRLIAAYNNKIAEITGQPAPGPTNSIADMALGQRAPQVVDANGNVTLGGQIDNFMQDLFGPKFVGLGTPAYNAINNNAGYNSNPEFNGQSMQPGYSPPPKNGGRETNIIPAVTNPVVTPVATSVTTPVTPVKSPLTLVSNFSRSYAGAPKNPYRYGYGPEATYYTMAAKGGMISPLNRMRDK